ncbi:TPA: hypothetical protein ACKQGH_005974, partial [Pseudomonas aeruginosa]
YQCTHESQKEIKKTASRRTPALMHQALPVRSPVNEFTFLFACEVRSENLATPTSTSAICMAQFQVAEVALSSFLANS